MTFGIIRFFPGGTKEQFEASLTAIGQRSGGVPERPLFYAAGPSGDGWLVVAFYDSKATWERFRDEILLPCVEGGIAGGFTTWPEESEVDIYALSASS